MKKTYKANIVGHAIPICIIGGLFTISFIYFKEFAWAFGTLVFTLILNATYWFDTLSIQEKTITHVEWGFSKKTVAISDIASTRYQGPSAFPSINLYDNSNKEIFFLGLATYHERTIAQVLVDLKNENQEIKLDDYSEKLIAKYSHRNK